MRRALDPLHIIYHSVLGKGKADPDPPPGATEKEAREHSIRVNRRRKFVDCIDRDDVDIGTCAARCAQVNY